MSVIYRDLDYRYFIKFLDFVEEFDKRVFEEDRVFDEIKLQSLKSLFNMDLFNFHKIIGLPQLYKELAPYDDHT